MFGDLKRSADEHRPFDAVMSAMSNATEGSINARDGAGDWVGRSYAKASIDRYSFAEPSFAKAQVNAPSDPFAEAEFRFAGAGWADTSMPDDVILPTKGDELPPPLSAQELEVSDQFEFPADPSNNGPDDIA